MKRTIIIIIVIIIVSVGIIFGLVSKFKNKTEYTTTRAKIGKIVQSVDATGYVESAEDIDLNFRTTGRISNINVKVGDKVKSGQVLANLEAGAFLSKVNDAKSVLLEEEANLEKILAGATKEDIKVSEITVEQKKQALESAKNNLENLKSDRDIKLTNLKNTAIIVLNNEIITAEGALETISSTLDYDDAQDTLSVLDSPKLIAAKKSQTEAINLVDDAKVYIATVSENSGNAEVSVAITMVENSLNKVKQCLSDVLDVLEATITSSKLSQSELDTLLTNIKTKQVSISTSRTNLQTAESNWTNKQTYYQDQITKTEDSIKSAQEALNLSQAQLDLKKAGPQNYEINLAKARIERAKASLVLANSNLSDTIIKAPVNGVIAKINYKIGEQTSLANAVIQMIGDSNLEIKVDIPESDITKIKVGQKTKITFDAFNDDTVLDGSVIFIDPIETIIQDVIYYQIKVQFDNLENKVKPGMTANVNIQTAKKNNILIIPLRAVKRKNGKQIVNVLINNLEQERVVETGLKGDEFVEILKGLEEGEEVITFVKNK